METVLVAGGAGFIGSNLCRSLLTDFKVVCVDDFSSGRRSNTEDLKKNKNYRLLEYDIIKPFDCSKDSLEEIDYVFHLASRASPNDYQSNPLHTLLSNSQGTMNLLELCRKTGAKFLFASTSEVYGDPLEHPQKETYRGNVNPTGIRACYDESKRLGETLTYLYLREYGVDARVIRIFNTYGPAMKHDDGRVVSNFIVQALKGEDITIYGDGSQTRSFAYVSDMVEGIKKALFCEGTKGETINLGNPDEFTINELADIIKEMIDTDSNIIYKKLPEDDPHNRNPDISKAKRLLGWTPKVALRDGLKETIDYFREELKQE
jgi:nucleoside-diphosphate-sugar epimerase